MGRCQLAMVNYGCGVDPWHLESVRKKRQRRRGRKLHRRSEHHRSRARSTRQLPKHGFKDPKSSPNSSKKGEHYIVGGFTQYGYQLTASVGYGRLNIESYFIVYLYDAGYRTPEKVAAAYRASPTTEAFKCGSQPTRSKT